MLLVVALLVLVSLATLAVGMATSGLPLVLVSIGAAALAGIVLALGILRSRGEGDLDDEAADLGSGGSMSTRSRGTAGRARSPRADVEEDEYEEDEYEEDEYEEDEYEEDEYEEDESFPIVGYDVLTAAEVLDALEHLDALDLAEVRSYEAGQRARRTILSRIDDLMEELTGSPGRTSALSASDRGTLEDFAADDDFEEDEYEEEEEEAYDDDFEEDEEEEDFEEDEEEEAYDDFEEDEDEEDGEPTGGLPVGDYDQLRSSEILTLLADLYPDELEAVWEHERATRGRETILKRIEALLDELEEEAAEQVPPPAPKRSAAGARQATKPAAPTKRRGPTRAPAAAPVRRSRSAGAAAQTAQGRRAAKPATAVGRKKETARPRPVEKAGPAPIQGYDSMSVAEITGRLGRLKPRQLQAVYDYERSHKARKTLLARLDAALRS